MGLRNGIGRSTTGPAGAALLLLSCFALAWPGGPAQAGTGDLEVRIDGATLSLNARSVPLDRVLGRLAEIYGFTASVRCGATACPKVQGRLTGKLDEVLAWLLHGHHYSRIHGPGEMAGGPGELQRLVVLVSRPGQPGPHERPAFSIAGQDAALAALADWGAAGDGRSAGLGRQPRPAAAPLALPRGSFAGLVAPVGPPMPDYRVTSGFGPRVDPLDGRRRWHQGVDLAATARSPVLSPAAGTVVSAGWHGNYGTMVTLDHGAGVTTRYAHLSKVLVEPGQVLAGGEPIGVIGQSGRSTAEHLHFELRIDERPVDPTAFLEAGRKAGRLAARLDRPKRPLPVGAIVINGF